MIAKRPTRPRLHILAVVALLELAMTGCQSVRPGGSGLHAQPSHGRDWDPTMAILPSAEFGGSLVRLNNVRRFRYLAADAYVPNYDNHIYDLNDIQTVDFIVVPFKSAPRLAHTMLSFGFADGEHVVVSVEARRERDEKYTALGGALNQYELMYVLADERDVIPLRAKHRGDEVYLYRTRATPEQARLLLVDVLQRVNELYQRPEFYNTLTNNCTTNLRNHVNRIAPGRVPWDVRVLLPGHSDRLVYNLGLLDTSLAFEDVRRQANVTRLASQFHAREDFSEQIRRF